MDDELLLASVPGAVDHLVAELGERSSAGEFEVDVRHRLPGAVVIGFRGALRQLAEVALFSGGGPWTVADASEGLTQAVARLVERTQRDGVLSALTSTGPPTFRVAQDLGDQRWPVRDALVATGWTNDPGDWTVNVRSAGSGVVLEIGALYQSARFGPLARIPASTTPVIAALLARLAKAEPGQLVLDPFCGAGTNLLAVARRVPEVRLIGTDVHSAAVRAARSNLTVHAPGHDWMLARGDATSLPLADAGVDRVVANLPFGKRVGSHRHNLALYPAALRELARALAPRGRAVLLTEDKRLFVEAVQRTAGLRVVKQLDLETGGLHPSAYVVTRGRSRRR